MPLRKNRILASWNIFDEPIPLFLQRDQAPCRVNLRRALFGAFSDGSEEHKPINKLRIASSKKACGHRSPGVRDNRDSLNLVTFNDESYGGIDLATRHFGTTERR